jgi:probable rRNA maturation factor
MLTVEVANRSGIEVAEEEAVELARRVLAAEGVHDGELGIAFVGPDEMRALKREHLGVDEPTDVLSFPIDARDELPTGIPRQLGDAVLCPQVVGDAWRGPLVHGLLHLLGYEHGREMESREAVHADALSDRHLPARSSASGGGGAGVRPAGADAGEGRA